MRRRLEALARRIDHVWERRRGEILSVHDGNPRARDFAEFGPGAYIHYPWRRLGNVSAIEIGAGTVIRHGVFIEAPAAPGTTVLHIGPDCMFGLDVHVVAVNGMTLESGVAVADNVYIADSIHDYRSAEEGQANWQTGLKLGRPMVIRSGVWIGANSVVTGGIEIGENAIIGPATVVNRDVPANTLVVGNPAHIVRRRRVDGGWDEIEPEPLG